MLDITRLREFNQTFGHGLETLDEDDYFVYLYNLGQIVGIQVNLINGERYTVHHIGASEYADGITDAHSVWVFLDTYIARLILEMLPDEDEDDEVCDDCLWYMTHSVEDDNLSHCTPDERYTYERAYDHGLCPDSHLALTLEEAAEVSRLRARSS